MPPPAPIFWKKVDENQVSYFIWPKGIAHGRHVYPRPGSLRVSHVHTCKNEIGSAIGHIHNKK